VLGPVQSLMVHRMLSQGRVPCIAVHSHVGKGAPSARAQHRPHPTLPTPRLSYRCGTSAARKLPDNFDEVKLAFQRRVCYRLTTSQIKPEFVVNMDHAGINLVPVGKRT